MGVVTKDPREPGKRFPPRPPVTPTKRAAPAPRKISAADRLAKVASQLPPAVPGARSKSKVPSETDNTVTSRIERISVEHTPAPLPPSPAEAAADTWFEQVPTNPAAIPDLGALAGSRPDLRTGLTRSRTPPRRQPPYAEDVAAAEAEPWPLESEDYSSAVEGSSQGTTWLLPVLLAATCLAVGMVLGALLFGGTSTGAKSDHDAGACVCPACPDTDQ